MRIVAEIPHPECKITVFLWNARYLIKVERGPIEQTYKISEHDIDGEAGVRRLLADKQFLGQVVARLGEMHSELHAALTRL